MFSLKLCGKFNDDNIHIHTPRTYFVIVKVSVSDPDLDPHHLTGSGSVSDDTDPDPGSAKNLLKP